MVSLSVPEGFITFWNPGEEFKKKTGVKVQSFVVPPISPVGMVSGGAGILNKMFGYAQPATKTATQGFPWLVAGGGAVLGAGTAMFFGKKGQEQTVSQQQQPIQITKTYSPVTTTTTTSTYSPSFMSISDSPYASMKKADVITAEPSIGVSPSWAISPAQTATQAAEQGQTAGTDLTMIAIIAGIALVASSYFSKSKGAKIK